MPRLDAPSCKATERDDEFLYLATERDEAHDGRIVSDAPKEDPWTLCADVLNSVTSCERTQSTVASSILNRIGLLESLLDDSPSGDLIAHSFLSVVGA